MSIPPVTGWPSDWQRRLAAQALKHIDRLERHLNPLRSRLQQDPYYRFRSFDEVAAAVRLGLRIDVNQATVDDWLRLPGLSIHQARTLVALTQQGVPLMCLEDVAAALSLPLQRFQPLADILDFRYYDQPLAPGQEPVQNPGQDPGQKLGQEPGQEPGQKNALEPGQALGQKWPINYVSGPQLMQVPGMTPALAQQLLYHRRFGPYRSWADLQQRLRLSPTQIGQLIHYLRV